jgi:hypothetical protein
MYSGIVVEKNTGINYTLKGGGSMKTKKNITRTEQFELVVDGTPLFVKATSFQTYTLETQYRVSVNGSPVYIFGWNPSLQRITAIDRGAAASNIPPRVVEAIGDQLYTRMAA